MYPTTVEAAWGDNNKNQKNFVFPDVVPKVNYKFLTLQGSLFNVSPTGITYTVKNMSTNTETAPTNRGISVSEDGTKITVANIELFDGDNLITFRGKQGSTDVFNEYQVTYISTPLLYNLQFTGGGKKLAIHPTDETTITADYSAGDSSFTIEGNAPNVSQVVVKNGSESYSARVNQDSVAYFIVGRVKLNRGLNKLTFLLKNDNQTVEVKRDVVYFDGIGTFYNVNMSYDQSDQDLSQKPVIKVTDTDATKKGKAKFEGYVIIPKEARLASFDPNTPSDVVRIEFLNQNDSATEAVPGPSISYEKKSETSSYVSYRFTYNGSSLPSTKMFEFDDQIYIHLSSFNPVETFKSDPTNPNPAPVFDDPTTTEFGYKFLDSGAPYLSSLEYRFSTGSTFNPFVDNTIINEKPFVVRLNVPNGTTDAGIKITSTNAYGVKDNVKIPSGGITTGGSGANRYYDVTVSELPFDGTQTLTIYYNENSYMSVLINAAAGPVVNFEGLTDGKVFKYDPTISNSSNGYAFKEGGSTKYLIRDILKEFKGRIDNVIVDPSSDYTNKVITVTVNNNEVFLKSNSTGTNHFILDTAKQSYGKVSGFFHDGQNTVVFKYKKGNLSYEKRFTVTLYSNDLPEIPVANTDGVFPYNTTTRKPDPRFVGSNGVYTTKETKMKVAGTFDFIDLGDTPSEVKSTIDSSIPKNKYLLVIEGPEGFSTKTWDLSQNTLLNGNSPFDNSKDDVRGLDVYYDMKKHFFTFVLEEQDIPTDGSKVVYTFTVYNNGLNGGSKATYRLEVSSPGVAYKILRPVRTGLQSTINQNYLEVVIEAKNAEKVMVGKVQAQKVNFDSDLDGKPDTPDAFRAIVTDLKPNKANKITFSITRGSDVVTDTFEVFYAPTNIPGAQFMASMEKAGKAFNNQLSLTFPKGTYLIRRDYNVPQELKGQIFKGHNILYAIANSEDGVVDRFDYLPDRPKNFDDTIASLGSFFKHSFDSHFVKVSNVFWVSAGLADDPNTDEYDPYPNGMLPIMPNPESMTPRLYNFDKIPMNRELVPSARGTLELTFDKNLVPSAAHNVTVMRFNPERYEWENIGGVVNAGKSTIKVPFDKFGYYVVAKLNDSFRDVVHHPYARDHMEAMYAKGVVLSKSSLDFGPDLPTTRGEFSAMVVRALELPLVDNISKPSFDDVVMDYNTYMGFDYRHIETAAKLGIVKGTDPRIFDPQGKITREEAAVILARALKLKTSTSASATKQQLSKLFKDYNLVNDYAAPYVFAIAKLKLIAGEPVDPTDLKRGYVFNPKAEIIRSDAAILMARVMQQLKKIPPVYDTKK